MKKYCIETFEKHKSDVVGEETLGDPLIEQKHTNKPLSNMPTSNIKWRHHPNRLNNNHNCIINPCRRNIINGNGK